RHCGTSTTDRPQTSAAPTIPSTRCSISDSRRGSGFSRKTWSGGKWTCCFGLGSGPPGDGIRDNNKFEALPPVIPLGTRPPSLATIDLMAPRSAVWLLGALIAAAPLAAQGRLSKEDADRFQSKLTKIVAFGNAQTAATSKPHSTPVTDVEVNSYFKYLAA